MIRCSTVHTDIDHEQSVGGSKGGVLSGGALIVGPLRAGVLSAGRLVRVPQVRRKCGGPSARARGAGARGRGRTCGCPECGWVGSIRESRIHDPSSTIQHASWIRESSISRPLTQAPRYWIWQSWNLGTGNPASWNQEPGSGIQECWSMENGAFILDPGTLGPGNPGSLFREP